MLVSVIIPVYKVEIYIERCVNSVLKQSFRNLEVIFVDDCSPDNSIGIAKSVISSSADSQSFDFIFLKHDYNQGLSAARNTGLNAAKGDYIFFLDSDDEITEDCIETLVSESEEGNVDVVCGGLEFCGPIEMFGFDTQYVCNDHFYMNNKDIVKAFVTGLIPISAWNKLLRREVLISKKIYFKEGLLFEDNLWAFILTHSVSTLKTLSHKTYHYWIRSGSIATSTTNMNRYKHMLVVMAEREKFLRNRNIHNNITDSYLIKDKALWIQYRLCENNLSVGNKIRLIFSVLLLNNKCAVLGLSVLYSIRWVLHQIKCFICR